MFISKIIIKDLRKNKNLTQKQLAQKAGLSQSTISDLEDGTKSPRLKTLDKIATALEIPTHELFITNKR